MDDRVNFLQVLTNPREAMARMRRRPRRGLVAFIVVVGALSSLVGPLAAGGVRIGLSPVGGVGLGLCGLGWLVALVVLWAAATALAHAFAGWMQGYGSPRALFWMFGLAMAPLCLMTPVGLLTAYLVPALLPLVFLLVGVLWPVGLALRAAREVYHLSPGRTWLAVVGPWLMLLVATPVTLGLVAFGNVLMVMGRLAL